MPQHGALDPDELLYRRISLKANPPQISSNDRAVLQAAFLPHKLRDTDGLTVIRAKYRNAKEVACPPKSSHRDYVVAVVRAGDLMELGLTLEVTPDEIDIDLGGTPAHVSIREMNADAYRDDNVYSWARQIAEHHVLEILGPFPL